MMEELTFQQRLDVLRATKMAQTRDKQQYGPMDRDDKGTILPPPELREVVQTMSASGIPIADVLLKGFRPKSNHPSGAFFGPKGCGENFRALLEMHPTTIDPMSSLAGGFMVIFMSYRVALPQHDPFWHPDFDYSHLYAEQQKYQLHTGIGAMQHFCQDLDIGLELGWGGLLQKIRHYRQVNAPRGSEMYDAWEDVVLGVQGWIRRHVAAARTLAQTETNPALRENLETMAAINERLVTDPPRTFREACQWILWFEMVACMYNNSGSLGKLDVLLVPYYQRDVQAGILTDEEAIFHIACLLLRETSYLQVGGLDTNGKDATNPVSYLVLEAIHRLQTPSNMAVAVGRGVDPNLLRRGVEILLEDKLGAPKFLGVDGSAEGFARNGYPVALGYARAYSGCHWCAIPGREFTVNDCTKINMAVVFEIAWKEMMADRSAAPSVANLWARFEKHLKRAVEVLAEGLDFHLAHMQEVFPEIVLDLLCHGTVEKGVDVNNGGVEFYNLCADGSGLATVADSFAAVEQRVEKEKRLNWEQLNRYLETNWAGAEGERARLMIKNIAHYGHGGSRADEYAVKVAQTFTRLVTEKPTPAGHKMIPGLFTWALAIAFGKAIGATPNGRHAGDPIAHGANPDPGFRKDGALTALALAVASVQPGYGNAAPLQLDLDPGILRDGEAVDHLTNLIKTHCDQGGTLINANALDTAMILAAHKDPSRYPDLLVRVTGFSAYFASLSPELRQFIVDRIVAEG